MIMTTFQNKHLQFWPNDSHKQSREERIACISNCN
jgi:hypothetical protein